MTPKRGKKKRGVNNRCLIFDDTDGNVGITENGKRERANLEKMRWRYAPTHGCWYKSRLIEELVAVCGYSRKHAIKLLNRRGVPRVLKRSGQSPFTRKRCGRILKRIWFASDQLCGKRLKAAEPEWLPHYEKEYGALQQPLKEKLAVISAASTLIGCLLRCEPKARPKGRGGTKPDVGSRTRSRRPPSNGTSSGPAS